MWHQSHVWQFFVELFATNSINDGLKKNNDYYVHIVIEITSMVCFQGQPGRVSEIILYRCRQYYLKGH